jgi:competence protein CoiA
MKFALLNGNRTEAEPNLLADCPNCGNPVRAFCGNSIVHHWKHVKLSECDDWYENETEWHREWKNHFSIEYQEIIRYDQTTNEKHISDIYNDKKNVVLEFQHSPIDINEIQAREQFYNRMIWVIDLISTNKNLEFLKKKSEVETVLHKMRHNLPKDFKVSEDFEMSKTQSQVEDFLSIQGLDILITKETHYVSQLEKNYTRLCNKKDYFLMTWKNLHKRWDFSSKHKFIDIGTDNIYQLIERVKIGNAYVVKRYSKSEFINHYR